MPRLNLKGQAAMGVGNSTVSIDGFIVAEQAGGARWMRDTIIFQSERNGPAELLSFQDGDIIRQVSKFGANTIATCPTSWGAYLASGLNRGIRFNSDIVSYPLSALGDGAIDSDRIVYIQDQQSGNGVVECASGKFYDFKGINDIRCYRDYFVVRCGNDVFIQYYDAQIPVKAMTLAPGTSAVSWAGTVYLLYNYGKYLIFHPYDSLMGRVITDNDSAFNPDVVYTTASALTIAYSLGQKELPNELVKLDMDAIMALPIQNLRDLGNNNPELPSIPTYAPFNPERKLWDGCFFSQSTRYGTNPSPLGNIQVIVDEGNSNAHARPMGNGIYVTDPKILNYSLIDRTICYWVGADPNDIDLADTDYDRALQQVEKPILFYVDTAGAWHYEMMEIAKQRKNRTWLGLQCYRNKGQDLFNYEHNVRRSLSDLLDKSGNMPIVLIITAYDRAGQLTEAEIVETYPVIDKITRAYPQIIGRLAFADMRPDGLTDHPNLVPYLEALFNVGGKVRPSRNDFWTKDQGELPIPPPSNTILEDIERATKDGYFTTSEGDYLEKLVIEDSVVTPPVNEDEVTLKVKTIVLTTDSSKLGVGDTEEARKENSYEFCLLVAQNCRAQALDVGLLYKPSGNNVNQRSIDIICIRRSDKTVDHYDIVVGAEAPNAYATFNYVGKVEADRFRVY